MGTTFERARSGIGTTEGRGVAVDLLPKFERSLQRRLLCLPRAESEQVAGECFHHLGAMGRDNRSGDIPIVPSRHDQGDGALSDSHQVRSPRSRPCVYGQRRCALFIERSLSFESPVRAGG